MNTSASGNVLSRRSALAGMGAGGLAVALTASMRQTSAQDAASLADHPLTGMWLAMANPALPENSQVPVPSYFGADGTVILVFPPADIGPQGTVLQSAFLGNWEAYDEMRGHFTAVQMLSAPDGTFLGTVTVDGFPQVKEDGQTFTDDLSLAFVTILDANGAVLQEIPPGGEGQRPVTGMRMGVGVPGIPDVSSGAATPTS